MTSRALKPVCSDCLKGHRIPGTPKGSIVKLGSIDAYFIEPSNGATKPGAAIVMGTDVFSLGLQNHQIMADEWAERCGCPVWIPDMFNGDWPNSDNINLPDEVVPNQSRLGKIWTILRVVPSILWNMPPTFFYRHRISVVQGRLRPFFKALREEKGVTKLGYAGYCWGGFQGAKLLNETDLIDVAVIAHPGPTSEDDWKNIRVPISFICADDDQTFGGEYREKVKKIIDSREHQAPSEWKTYEGTTHGFACRPNISIPKIKKAFEDAKDQAVNWFNEYLK